LSKKILFLVAHRPGRSPGQRFRFEQYIDYLKQHGFEYHISYLIDKNDDTMFYARGKYFDKMLFLFRSIRQRWKDVKMARDFDLIFLYREAHMLGTTVFEKKLAKTGVPMIVDFDDSIWLKDISKGNRNLSFLKRPGKTAEIISLCNASIVGNNYLAAYAGQYSKNVFIVPTTIDTDYYQPVEKKKTSEAIVIGWTGSSTTIKHFSLAVPILQKIRQKYGDKVRFMMISDEPYIGHLEGLEFVKWNRGSEVADLSEIDIGIMPLPDDAWSRGKCGFKGLQYMALQIPAVMSPVGVNTEIINHSKNGFLADSTEAWQEILSQLIEDKALRKSIGQQGRKTVEAYYSYHSQKDRYLNIFRGLLKQAL
jgi:glycosyltransferase involved in cell wall biosynthesis